MRCALVTGGQTCALPISSSARGIYNLASLPPETYRVDVTADGQTSSQTLTLAVGQTVTLNLGLGGVPETGPAGEATDLATVVVPAPAMVETKPSEVTTYVPQKHIHCRPQTSRNLLPSPHPAPGRPFIPSP